MDLTSHELLPPILLWHSSTRHWAGAAKPQPPNRQSLRALRESFLTYSPTNDAQLSDLIHPCQTHTCLSLLAFIHQLIGGHRASYWRLLSPTGTLGRDNLGVQNSVFIALWANHRAIDCS